LRRTYLWKVLQIADMSFLSAAPIEKVNLAAMRKHRTKLMETTGLECAFQLKTISAYAKQKMLLTILYKGIVDANVTKMAKILNVSKMSVTRCFDELEAFQLGMIDDNGKAGRHFRWTKTKGELWETVRPFLRNPVEKEFSLDCLPPWPLPISGLTAISHFSMLADNSFGTYAITKQAVKDLHPENLP
jgi:hypothetical protein